MKPPTDCPFLAIAKALSQIPQDVRIIVIDVHAEATSEKIAIGWHFDGRVSAVFGTHTHIPTADERILPNGTAYITDVGMTGPYDSVLGRRKDRVLKALLTGLHVPFDVATDDIRLCGCWSVLIRQPGGPRTSNALGQQRRVCFRLRRRRRRLSACPGAEATSASCLVSSRDTIQDGVLER
jgi:calcineurin-like phosphoesterase